MVATISKNCRFSKEYLSFMMDIVHGPQLEFQPPPLKHRGTGIEFKDLFCGTEGSPSNYYFALVQQGKFYSPIHKHNFDQYRYAYRGDFSIASDVTIHEGEFAYHPEGVEYGPQDDGNETEHVLLIVQFGGASGQGFLTYHQLATGQAKLGETGKFEKGKYYPSDGSQPVDGFQALWEFYNYGRKLNYPAGRYNAPILMKPNNFAWKAINDNETGSKAYKKVLGVFSEGETAAGMIKIEKDGFLKVAAKTAVQLFFVTKGEGRVNNESLMAESAMRLQPGHSTILSSTSTMEMVYFVLPTLQ